MTLVDWLRNRGYPEDLEGFYVDPPCCVVCLGRLIGDEIRWGTCGHCGGRSVCRDGFPSFRPGEFKDRP